MNIKTVRQLKANILNPSKIIYLVNDSIYVPEDEKNADYQAILRWVANGGIIET